MSEKYSTLIELLNAWMGGAATTVLAAFLGRAMWHGNEARKGHRRFFGMELLWELPVAIGMAIVGESVASYLDASQPVRTGMVAALAYLGPRGLEVILGKWFSHKIAK